MSSVSISLEVIYFVYLLDYLVILNFIRWGGLRLVQFIVNELIVCIELELIVELCFCIFIDYVDIGDICEDVGYFCFEGLLLF